MKHYLKVVVIVKLMIVFLPNTGLSQVVSIQESDLISQMMKRYKEHNQSKSVLRAWRIQIISTDDRRTMERVKSEFEAKFPRINTSWKHMAPYYQIRVGAYQTKAELMPFLMEIKESFPTAFAVQDNIDKIDFVK